VGDYYSSDNPLVLVAEDSATVLAMVTARLERSGYDVIAARDGEAAVQLARERLPAVVILDVEMPVLNGLEVARRLRGDEATRAIPIIMLTGNDGAADIEAGLAAGAAEYVTKPFSPQDLMVSVERILGRR
jgi:two-component system phosphate regulon response regulator PhoB